MTQNVLISYAESEVPEEPNEDSSMKNEAVTEEKNQAAKAIKRKPQAEGGDLKTKSTKRR